MARPGPSVAFQEPREATGIRPLLANPQATGRTQAVAFYQNMFNLYAGAAGACRSRDGDFPPPPGQTSARATNAHGSHLGARRAQPLADCTRFPGIVVHRCSLALCPRSARAWKSPRPTAFPPCAPPTLHRPGSRTSSVLCSRSTPRRRACGTYRSSRSPNCLTGSDGVSRFSPLEFLCMPGVLDSAGPLRTRVSVRSRIAFWSVNPNGFPERSLRSSITQPTGSRVAPGNFTPRRSQIPDVNLSIHPARATA